VVARARTPATGTVDQKDPPVGAQCASNRLPEGVEPALGYMREPEREEADVERGRREGRAR
jgi:hypothetical protein